MKRLPLFLLTTLLVAVSTMFFDCKPDPDITPPAEVTSLTATPGNAQVSLAWTDPADADFNEVEITVSPTVTGSPFTVDEGVETKVITGLTNSTEYTFTIKTKDDTGNTSSGTSKTATPVAPTQTVATPTGNQVGNKVFLTTTTSGAAILYSVDGTTPSLTYTSAGIVVKTGTVVKAKATKTDWNDSVVFSDTYTAVYNRIEFGGTTYRFTDLPMLDSFTSPSGYSYAVIKGEYPAGVTGEEPVIISGGTSRTLSYVE
jgi:hypothetical protein